MNRYKCMKCGGNQYSALYTRAHEPCIYCGKAPTVLMDNIDPKSDELQEGESQ